VLFIFQIGNITPRRRHISSAQHHFNSSPQTGENW